MLHKPVGVITTLRDPEGRKSVADLIPKEGRLYPVGRLDADTSGLLIVTNDGELAHHLMHPRYGLTKFYRVLLAREPNDAQLARIAAGVEFEPGLWSAPARVRRRDPVPRGAVIEIALHEGRHRQVRRMCEAVGLTVLGLHRWAYGPLKLGELARGVWRELSEEEVELLRRASARPHPRPPGAGQMRRPRREGRPEISRGPRAEDRGPGAEVRGEFSRGPRREDRGTSSVRGAEGRRDFARPRARADRGTQRRMPSERVSSPRFRDRARDELTRRAGRRSRRGGPGGAPWVPRRGVNTRSQGLPGSRSRRGDRPFPGEGSLRGRRRSNSERGPRAESSRFKGRPPRGPRRSDSPRRPGGPPRPGSARRPGGPPRPGGPRRRGGPPRPGSARRPGRFGRPRGRNGE